MALVKKRIRLTSTKPKPVKKKASNPLGRPEVYQAKFGAYICKELIKGRTLTKIAQDKSLPCLATIFGWLNPMGPNFHEEFLNSYRQARKIQAEVLADQSSDISDERDKSIGRQALRVKTRQWMASKLDASKFGDKMQVTGKDDGPVVFKVVYEDAKAIPLDDLSGEEK